MQRQPTAVSASSAGKPHRQSLQKAPLTLLFHSFADQRHHHGRGCRLSARPRRPAAPLPHPPVVVSSCSCRQRYADHVCVGLEPVGCTWGAGNRPRCEGDESRHDAPTQSAKAMSGGGDDCGGGPPPPPQPRALSRGLEPKPPGAGMHTVMHARIAGMEGFIAHPPPCVAICCSSASSQPGMCVRSPAAFRRALRSPQA